jgi:hypothetical protein
MESPAADFRAGQTRAPARWWWIGGAFVVAIAIAILETRLREMQSALLIYFLASFWLALPRRAPSAAIFAALAAGPFVAHTMTGTPRDWSAIATLGALFLGSAAGAIGGRAFAELDASPRPTGTELVAAAAQPAVGTRTLLALALTAFAALGVSPVWATIRLGGLALGFLPLAPIAVTLIAVRWAQALTLVAWVMVTPVLLRIRRQLRSRAAREHEAALLTLDEVVGHLGLVTLLIALHTIVLVTLASLLAPQVPIFMGAPPDVGKLALALATSYGLFDLLTYIAILGLAHVTDRTRQAEEARRRAAALEATAVTARLAALKARLDPHFLYNALNAAVTLARRGQGEDTSRVLEELTALLRYVLDESRTAVPLSEELAFVRRYLDIMQLRFGPRLTYSIRVDAGVTDAPVPPLILQPLVENAVEHGVANAAGPVAVHVSARAAAHGLVIAVEDDGPGPNAAPRTGTGIGLGATRERLAMLFGGTAELTLGLRVPRGAVAELTLPLSSASSG